MGTDPKTAPRDDTLAAYRREIDLLRAENAKSRAALEFITNNACRQPKTATRAFALEAWKDAVKNG